MVHHIYRYDTQASLVSWLDAHSPASSNSILIQIFAGIIDPDIIHGITKTITQKLPDAVVIGSTTGGEIYNEEIEEKTILISMALFEKTNLKSIHIADKSSQIMGKGIVESIVDDDTKCLIMFADGMKCNGDEILKAIDSRSSKELIIAGGMSGDNGLFQQTYCIHGNEVFDNGVVAVSLSSPELEVFHTYNLSWKAIGKKMKVTRSKGNVLYELDNLPVKDVYAKYLGESTVKEMPVSAIEFPLIIHETDIDIARSMIALTDDGGIVYAGEIPEGKEVRFGVGSPNMLATAALGNYNLALSHPIEGMFLYSCIARKAFLGKGVLCEFFPLSKIAPLAGFFTYGEFYRGAESNKLLNVTTTVLGLSETKVNSNKKSLKDEDFQQSGMTINALMNLVEVTLKENEEYAQELVKTNDQLKQKDHALEKQKELYELVFKNTLSGVLIIDIEANRFIDCNEAAIKLLKCDSRDDVLNLRPSELSPEYQPDGKKSEEKSYEMNALALKNGAHTFEWKHLTKTKEEIWIEVVLTPITLDKTEVLHVMWTDINDRKEIEGEILKQKMQLAYQAHHDSLTKLPNRLLFNDRLSQTIVKAKRHKRDFALFFIDLDGFKPINDSLGHAIGDKVLQEISSRIKGMIREEDTLARLGGDEFTVIMEDITKKEDAAHLAQKILDALSRPLVIDGHALQVSCSIGISLFSDDANMDADKLLIYADAAMYKAKDKGKDNFQFYKD
ncbi:diguanylate cyclase [Sulfurimonas sp. HSL3-2]|uniref:diguanylate cyclase domain-containing protein n=1 Tax=Hydrocurvibacter mobilis TaxID=3131936 RepID=UPI0031F7C08A